MILLAPSSHSPTHRLASSPSASTETSRRTNRRLHQIRGTHAQLRGPRIDARGSVQGPCAATNLRKLDAWDALSAEQKRLVDKMLLDGKRARLALERKEDKERLRQLQDELLDPHLKFTVRGLFSL